MCRLCGREACSECFQQVKVLTEEVLGASVAEMAAAQARREKHSHTNPFFLGCTRRHEHRAVDFSPMSRFCKPELQAAITEMEVLLRKEDVDAIAVSNTIVPPVGVLPIADDLSTLANPDGTTDSSASTGTAADAAQPIPPSSSPVDDLLAANAIPSLSPRRFTDAELTEDVFRPLWTNGDPIIVLGLLENFKIKWTPDYFIEKYESQSCLILECQSDQNKRITVGEFFSWFGQYEGRTECWKLKVIRCNVSMFSIYLLI